MPRDSLPVKDNVIVEIKGPDPEVWGEDHERPEPVSPGGLGLHEVKDEGTDNEVKGPGAEWEVDEEGNYVNR